MLANQGKSLTANTFLDPNAPNMTRIFDYLVGGSAHFEVDRQAAIEMLALIPSLQKWVRLRRAFSQEAVHQLYQQGFRQFLDLGSGMPSVDHIHISAPAARIVYSDINPVAVSYGHSLFSQQTNIAYVEGDARRFHELVKNSTVRHLINPHEKVAIGLNALLLFLELPEIQALAQEIFSWAPKQSQLFVVLQTRGDIIPHSQRYAQFINLTKQAGLPMHIHTLPETIGMLKPWQPETVQPITHFLGLPHDFITEADREGIGMTFFAAFLNKPATKRSSYG